MTVYYTEAGETDPPSFGPITDNSTATTPTNSTDVQINITATDPSGISACILSWNDTITHVFENQTTIYFDGGSPVIAIWNETIEHMPITGGTIGCKAQCNDTLGNSNVSDIHTITVQAIVVDSCSCPSPPADWHIINGDICSIESEVCNIIPYKFRVLNGAMRIKSGGFIRAGGCFVKDGESLYVDDNGGLYCEG